jgi:DNA-binding NarL/FixJ family response regulator
MSLRILDVGQCGIDGPRMERLFREKLGATVSNASSIDEVRQCLKQDQCDIVLVNRDLAGDGSSGVELIASLMKEGCQVPMMLVSDYPQAQDEAVACGALRGFGKTELDNPATLKLIQKAAGGQSS